jgi:hypothetical protein
MVSIVWNFVLIRGSGGKMTIFSNGSYDQSEYPNPLIYPNMINLKFR